MKDKIASVAFAMTERGFRGAESPDHLIASEFQ